LGARARRSTHADRWISSVPEIWQVAGSYAPASRRGTNRVEAMTLRRHFFWIGLAVAVGACASSTAGSTGSSSTVPHSAHGVADSTVVRRPPFVQRQFVFPNDRLPLRIGMTLRELADAGIDFHVDGHVASGCFGATLRGLEELFVAVRGEAGADAMEGTITAVTTAGHQPGPWRTLAGGGGVVIGDDIRAVSAMHGPLSVSADEPGPGVIATSEVDASGNRYSFVLIDDRVQRIGYGRSASPAGTAVDRVGGEGCL
jgi:hypothetical protein